MLVVIRPREPSSVVIQLFAGECTPSVVRAFTRVPLVQVFGVQILIDQILTQLQLFNGSRPL